MQKKQKTINDLYKSDIMLYCIGMLTAEEIEKNFNKFRSLCEKLGDRAKPTLEMVDTLGNNLALCPASSKKMFHLSEPGGLVDHSLRVLSNVLKLNTAYAWNLPKESMIIASLLHDIGKVGFVDEKNEFTPYYIDAEDWRKQKMGELYTVNNDMPYMTTPHRSVFLCQHFGIKLNRDEYLSILTNDGFVVDENKVYCLKISPLTYAVQTADYISTMSEKSDESSPWKV